MVTDGLYFIYPMNVTGKAKEKTESTEGKATSPKKKSQKVPEKPEVAPELVVKPRRQFTDDGATAKFKASFDGSKSTVLFWSKDGVVLSSDEHFKIYEADGFHYLEVVHVTADDTGIYSVTVQNSAGEDSASAELEVFVKPKLLSKSGPEWEQPLKDLVVPEDEENVELKCVAKDITKPTCKWFHNGQEIFSGFRMKLSHEAQTSTLSIKKIRSTDAGEFKCIMAGSNGELETSCHLKVGEDEELEAPVFVKELEDIEVQEGAKLELGVEVTEVEHPEAPDFITQPISSLTSQEGKTVTFTCHVKGQPQPQVMWEKGGVAIASSQKYKLTQIQDKHSLFIYDVGQSDVGEYTCHLQNSVGKTSSTCTLHLADDETRGTDEVKAALKMRLSKLRELHSETERPATVGEQRSHVSVHNLHPETEHPATIVELRPHSGVHKDPKPPVPAPRTKTLQDYKATVAAKSAGLNTYNTENSNPVANYRATDSDKIKLTDNDKIKPTDNDKIKPTDNDKIKPTGNDKIKLTDNDRIKPTGNDKIKSTGNDKIKSTGYSKDNSPSHPSQPNEPISDFRSVLNKKSKTQTEEKLKKDLSKTEEPITDFRSLLKSKPRESIVPENSGTKQKEIDFREVLSKSKDKNVKSISKEIDSVKTIPNIAGPVEIVLSHSDRSTIVFSNPEPLADHQNNFHSSEITSHRKGAVDVGNVSDQPKPSTDPIFVATPIILRANELSVQSPSSSAHLASKDLNTVNGYDEGDNHSLDQDKTNEKFTTTMSLVISPSAVSVKQDNSGGYTAVPIQFNATGVHSSLPHSAYPTGVHGSTPPSVYPNATEKSFSLSLNSPVNMVLVSSTEPESKRSMSIHINSSKEDQSSYNVPEINETHSLRIETNPGVNSINLAKINLVETTEHISSNTNSQSLNTDPSEETSTRRISYIEFLPSAHTKLLTSESISPSMPKYATLPRSFSLHTDHPFSSQDGSSLGCEMNVEDCDVFSEDSDDLSSSISDTLSYQDLGNSSLKAPRSANEAGFSIDRPLSSTIAQNYTNGAKKSSDTRTSVQFVSSEKDENSNNKSSTFKLNSNRSKSTSFKPDLEGDSDDFRAVKLRSSGTKPAVNSRFRTSKNLSQSTENLFTHVRLKPVHAKAENSRRSQAPILDRVQPKAKSGNSSSIADLKSFNTSTRFVGSSKVADRFPLRRDHPPATKKDNPAIRNRDSKEVVKPKDIISKFENFSQSKNNSYVESQVTSAKSETSAKINESSFSTDLKLSKHVPSQQERSEVTKEAGLDSKPDKNVNLSDQKNLEPKKMLSAIGKSSSNDELLQESFVKNKPLDWVKIKSADKRFSLQIEKAPFSSRRSVFEGQEDTTALKTLMKPKKEKKEAVDAGNFKNKKELFENLQQKAQLISESPEVVGSGHSKSRVTRDKSPRGGVIGSRAKHDAKPEWVSKKTLKNVGARMVDSGVGKHADQSVSDVRMSKYTDQSRSDSRISKHSDQSLHDVNKVGKHSDQSVSVGSRLSKYTDQLLKDASKLSKNTDQSVSDASSNAVATERHGTVTKDKTETHTLAPQVAAESPEDKPSQRTSPPKAGSEINMPIDDKIVDNSDKNSSKISENVQQKITTESITQQTSIRPAADDKSESAPIQPTTSAPEQVEITKSSRISESYLPTPEENAEIPNVSQWRKSRPSRAIPFYPTHDNEPLYPTDLSRSLDDSESAISTTSMSSSASDFSHVTNDSSYGSGDSRKIFDKEKIRTRRDPPTLVTMPGDDNCITTVSQTTLKVPDKTEADTNNQSQSYDQNVSGKFNKTNLSSELTNTEPDRSTRLDIYRAKYRENKLGESDVSSDKLKDAESRRSYATDRRSRLNKELVKESSDPTKSRDERRVSSYLRTKHKVEYLNSDSNESDSEVLARRSRYRISKSEDQGGADSSGGVKRPSDLDLTSGSRLARLRNKAKSLDNTSSAGKREDNSLSSSLESLEAKTASVAVPEMASSDQVPSCPPSFPQLLSNISVMYGSRATLQCKVTGNPTPDIRWLMNLTPIEPTHNIKVSYEQDVAQLVILETYTEHVGEYTCWARNPYGSISTHCQLTLSVSSRAEGRAFEGPVSQAPRVVSLSPPTASVLSGTVLQFTLTYLGNPAPSVKWQLNGKALKPDERVCMQTDDTSSVLTFNPALQADAGTLSACLTSSIGSDEVEAKISIEDVPGVPVGQPHVYEIGSTSAALSWCGPLFDGGSPIIYYIIEAKTRSQKTWDVLIPQCKELSCHIFDLKPCTTYQFRVCAANMHGLSAPSEPSEKVITTDPFRSPSDYESEGYPEVFTPTIEYRRRDELPFEPRDVKANTKDQFEDVYDLQNEVGKGKFGIVYKCNQKSDGSVFAAKIIKCREKEKNQLKNEIEIMNKLRHPKLLMLWDAFEEARRIILVMEYVGAGELFERVIGEDFVLTERDCVHFLRQICEGVSYMHNLNILHLDLKPENILCVAENSNRIKIIDFGLARFFKAGESVKVLFGTPEFIAPEVINYDEIGFSTDMWSIGVICYVLLSGLSPFLGDSEAETLASVTSGEFDFDDEAFDEISDQAKDFISKLLVKKKEDRMLTHDCLTHDWLNQDEVDGIRYKRLNTERLKRFMVRRKWMKTGKAVLAVGRLRKIPSQNNFNLSRSNSNDSILGSRSSSPSRSVISESPGQEGETQSPTLTRSELMSSDDHLDEISPKIAQSSNVNGLADNSDIGNSQSDKKNIGNSHKATSLTKEENNKTIEGRAVHKNLKENFVSENSKDLSSINSDSKFRRDKKDISQVKETAKIAPASNTASPSLAKKKLDDKQLDAGTLTKTSVPVFTKTVKNCKACAGDSARFDVIVSGDPSPEVTWFLEDDEVHQDDRHTLNANKTTGAHSLIIRSIEEDDEGEYVCKAVNSHGEVTCSAELTVLQM